jgi:hypothetical protein
MTPGRCGVFGNKALDGVPAELMAAYAGEQSVLWFSTAFPQPCFEQLRGVVAEWSATSLSTLTLATNVRTCLQHYVLAAKANQLRDPQAGLERQREECLVSTTRPGREIGCRKKRIDLGLIEELDLLTHVSFAWHC